MTIFFLIFLFFAFLFYHNKINHVSKTRSYCFLSSLWVSFSLPLLSNYSYQLYPILALLIFLFCLIIIDKKHNILKYLLFLAVVICFSITICIVFSVLLQSLEFFSKVPIVKFLFGLRWNHDATIVSGKAIGDFGIVSLLVGTLLITMIAILVAVPLGLFSAIYISEYANKKVRYIINTILEVLSAIPTVVYGYFAVVFLSSFIRKLTNGLDIQSENALVAGLAIGIMIFPFITSLMEDAIRSVPKSLRYGFMALGATPAETIWHITLPCAFPTIVSSVILAISRAIGETMIVLMTVGVNAQLTFNPLRSVTTVTVQIATLLTGDQDFNSVQTLAAYALSLVLFIITWLLNALALFIVKKNNA